MKRVKYLLPVLLFILLACVYAQNNGHRVGPTSVPLVTPSPALDTNPASSAEARIFPNSTLKNIPLASKEELLREVCQPPVDNPDREKAVANLFIQAGATAAEVKYQPLDPAVATSSRNVMLIKPGRTDKIIVVGGHLDKVAVGNGVIDDWSGTCAMTNIYQALRQQPTEHTIIFIGFTDEERGLVGSSAFVKNIKDDEKARYQAMVNLECLGTGDSHIWLNFVAPKMKESLITTATRENLPLFGHEIPGVSADSKTFFDAGIPSITIDSLTDFSFIHTVRDNCERVNIDNYYNSYRLMVAYLLELDQTLDKPAVNTKEPSPAK